MYICTYTVRRKTCCVKHDRGWWMNEKQQEKGARELLEASFVRCSSPACRPQGRAQKSLPMFQSMGPFLGSKFGPKIGSILVTNKYGIHASNSSRASLSCCFSFIHHPLSCFRQHYVFLRTVYIVVWSSCQNASWTETCVHLVEIPQHHYPFKCKTHIVQLHAITSIAYVVQRRQKQIEATRCNDAIAGIRKAWSWLSPQSVLSLSIFCATSISWHGPSFHPRQGISTMSTMAMVTAITMY